MAIISKAEDTKLPVAKVSFNLLHEADSQQRVERKSKNDYIYVTL